MWSRIQALQETLAGYEKTHIPLVAYNGKEFLPSAAWVGDDSGAYYFIPAVSRLFHVNLQTAADLFYFGIILGALILGIIGIFLFQKTLFGKVLGIFYIVLMAFLSVHWGDAYVVYAPVILATIPIFLFLSADVKRMNLVLVWIFVSGVLACVSNLIRFHSGSTVLIFITLFVLCRTGWTKRQKAAGLGILLAGVLCVMLWFHHVVERRNQFFVTHPTSYTLETHHPVWHQLYIGLGFLSNQYGIAYDDYVGQLKAWGVDPAATFPSDRYQAVMKELYVSIVRHHPLFTVYTYASKTGVVLFYLLLCMNLGLLAAAFYPKPMSLELPFWGSIFFSMLSGILVMPWPQYLAGFFALATLYGAVSLDSALSRGLWKRATRRVAYSAMAGTNGT